ncbi:MAG: DUF5615 family PIN-like protein [Candidatus Margulisiibacteriota bacterium]
MKFLADENISPKTIEFIRKAGYDIVGVREVGLKGKKDKDIVDFAIKEKRTVITFDLDYGEIYYFSAKVELGVVVLKTKSQWIENVNLIILKLFKSGKLETEEFKSALVIVTEERYRVRKK